MLTEIHVVTLFPDWFEHLKDVGLTGRAVEEGRVRMRCFNPREHADGVHRSVDDRPYGGGPGMVMRPEPLAQAIEAARAGSAAPVSGLSPQGRPLNQRAVEQLAGRDRLILVCGRYEGIDERVNEALIDEEWSIGDFVLSGGEYAAAAVMDAVIRLLPGVLGHASSAAQDSFSQGLLDCPHYTRPETWRERRVPGVLLTGDHAAIARWRREQALLRTARRRPDLLEAAELDDAERAWLEAWPES
ncbi:MAG: tRNA (guanosine(37)-N1)-methyltransferase TrmD [Wenzhouxiangellaceae bacterium]|nr:tRNA (guanosine(37)-N1)-methyltransferase TrmD [Wenzhouxiangellaceae bacterium]MBS3747222.1 tRNA (guanosine(37)-N1)-methyltransferase TrmD [Wenzhouxiangellaceae bacterium]